MASSQSRKKRAKKRSKVKTQERQSEINPRAIRLVAEFWFRENKIEQNRSTFDVAAIVADYGMHIYRCIAANKNVYCEGPKRLRSTLPTGIYATKQEFNTDFVNNEKFQDNDKHHEVVEQLLKDSNTRIDFDKEFVLIIHKGIGTGYRVEMEGAEITSDNSLVFTIEQTQRKLYKGNHFWFWCFAINKKCGFPQIGIKVINHWADDDPDSYGTNKHTQYLKVELAK